MFESYCREKLGPLMLRLAVGLVCVYHGYSKIMASGGTSWAPGLHVFWQLAIAWGEFVAGLAILAGFRCRAAALLAAICVVGQSAWYYGWELFRLPLPRLEPLVIFVLMATALLFLGAGGLALDSGGGGGGAFPRPGGKKR